MHTTAASLALPGEEKSVAYVISQIKSIGLQPGTPTREFVQKVPLYGTRSRGTLAITAGGTHIPMAPGEDFRPVVEFA
jgi:hypothetical protein